MTVAPISHRPHRGEPDLPLAGGLALRRGRVHEFCGPARRTLALIAARAADGPLFWIAPDRERDRLNGEGIVAFLDPGRITFVSPHRPEDLLWSMEEVLRAGVAPLAVCECPGIPGLTAVRRLHLAAKSAGCAQEGAPLGLLLLAGEGGAPGVETRWHMAPAHGAAPERWRLERRRDRLAPPRAWELTRRGSSFLLGPVPAHPDSATAARTDPAAARSDRDTPEGSRVVAARP